MTATLLNTDLLPIAKEGITDEVLDLVCKLISFPSVTNCPDERLGEVHNCGSFIADWLRRAGAEVRHFHDEPYPSVLVGFPGQLLAPVMLSGHFDVVPPEPGIDHFTPKIEGDYLWGRGSADMKTVVASFMVWFRRRIEMGAPYPPINMLLVGNEENGEHTAWGTPQVLECLKRESDYEPRMMLVGERTEETGTDLYGEICTASRGIARLRVHAEGVRGHTGIAGVGQDLVSRICEAHQRIEHLFTEHLTLHSHDGWQSSARFPFLNAGDEDVFNITAARASLGIEIRPIPEDDLEPLIEDIGLLCRQLDLRFEVVLTEAGNSCPLDHPDLEVLRQAVKEISGAPAVLGRKLPGCSARFAPGGRALVWGQAGIGPHSSQERHYIPSIEPYLLILDAYAKRL